MNQSGLIQHENGLIGSEADIAALESKASAKILVVSDTHGESELLQTILESFGGDADALVFCGDGICDMAFCMERAHTDEDFCALLPPVLSLVRGNGDASSYTLMLDPDDFETQPALHSLAVPDWVCFEAAGRTVYAVHGHRHNVDYGIDTLVSTAYTMDADMVFFGHTHCPYTEETEGTLFLNPGSVARPRGGSSPSFAVVSFPGATERFFIERFAIDRTIFGGWHFYPL